MGCGKVIVLDDFSTPLLQSGEHKSAATIAYKN